MDHSWRNLPISVNSQPTKLVPHPVQWSRSPSSWTLRVASNKRRHGLLERRIEFPMVAKLMTLSILLLMTMIEGVPEIWPWWHFSDQVIRYCDVSWCVTFPFLIKQNNGLLIQGWHEWWYCTYFFSHRINHLKLGSHKHQLAQPLTMIWRNHASNIFQLVQWSAGCQAAGGWVPCPSSKP